MHFDVEKDLKNKVFKIDVKRKFKADDAENIKEAQLENDFGNVQVQTGGLFVGYATESDGTYTVSLVEDSSATKVAFSLPENTMTITKDSVISMTVDASKEAKVGDIPALKVAELKCDVFSASIQKRLEDAIEEWKKQVTDFESKDPTSFDIPLE